MLALFYWCTPYLNCSSCYRHIHMSCVLQCWPWPQRWPRYQLHNHSGVESWRTLPRTMGVPWGGCGPQWGIRQNCIVIRVAMVCSYTLSFYPRPVLAFGYCRCLRLSVCVCPSVCVSVNPELVCTINHHAFKLEPLNLDKRCKTTWLRSLLFWGAIDLDLQGQI